MIHLGNFERGIARANKVYVHTKYSTDGHYLEGFWIDYQPDDTRALFLLQFTLDNNPKVEFYTIYDKNGDRWDY